VAIALNFAVHLGSNIQMLIITFIILFTLRMQAVFRPYRHALVNSLSVYLLTVFICVLVMGAAVYREPSELGAGCALRRVAPQSALEPVQPPTQIPPPIRGRLAAARERDGSGAHDHAPGVHAPGPHHPSAILHDALRLRLQGNRLLRRLPPPCGHLGDRSERQLGWWDASPQRFSASRRLGAAPQTFIFGKFSLFTVIGGGLSDSGRRSFENQRPRV
jgi:hypothetical protein